MTCVSSLVYAFVLVRLVQVPERRVYVVKNNEAEFEGKSHVRA